MKNFCTPAFDELFSENRGLKFGKGKLPRNHPHGSIFQQQALLNDLATQANQKITGQTATRFPLPNNNDLDPRFSGLQCGEKLPTSNFNHFETFGKANGARFNLQKVQQAAQFRINFQANKANKQLWSAADRARRAVKERLRLLGFDEGSCIMEQENIDKAFAGGEKDAHASNALRSLLRKEAVVMNKIIPIGKDKTVTRIVCSVLQFPCFQS